MNESKHVKLKTKTGLFENKYAGLTSDELTANLDMDMSLSYKYSTFTQ